MRGGRLSPFVLALLIAGIAGTTLSAHRRDEYLQAARLAIEPRRVDVQLDLTPGIAIADRIVGDIDRDRDGTLSRDEQEAYVGRVLDAIELRVDGDVLRLERVESTFPSLDAIRGGEGTIRLRTVAVLPRLSNGDHELAFRNRHRPDVSVYLANALVPDGDSIAITAQHRDPAQRTLAIHYVVRNRWSASAPAWLTGIGAMLLTGVLNYYVRNRLMACHERGARRRGPSRMADVAQG